MAIITQPRLREALDYDPNTGIFCWRSPRKRIRVGAVAGSPDKDGYVQIKLDQRVYKAHRLAWFWMTGQWPPEEIDHKDRDKANNRWSNLRLASKSENMANVGVYRHSGTQIRGVQFDARKHLYSAKITVSKRRHWLGYFKTTDAAAAAYQAASLRLRGA